MSTTTRDPSAHDDLPARPVPGTIRRWVRAHIVPIALAILAGGIGGALLYLLVEVL
jgi:hypothetical protein